jgi:hypothetical protein
MAIIEELQQFMDKRGYGNNSSVHKMARDLSPADQKGFLQNMQLGDSEFQAQVAPNVAVSGAELDPAKAKAHSTLAPLTLMGKSIPETGRASKQEYSTSKGRGVLEFEPGTVNAVGMENANPQTWAHEYRHQENMDGYGESDNRIFDLVGSTTDDQLGEGVFMIVNGKLGKIRDRYNREKDPTKKEALKSEFNRLADLELKVNGDNRADNAKDAFAEMLDLYPSMSKRLKDFDTSERVEPTGYMRNILELRSDGDKVAEEKERKNNAWFKSGGPVKLI